MSDEKKPRGSEVLDYIEGHWFALDGPDSAKCCTCEALIGRDWAKDGLLLLLGPRVCGDALTAGENGKRFQAIDNRLPAVEVMGPAAKLVDAAEYQKHIAPVDSPSRTEPGVTYNETVHAGLDWRAGSVEQPIERHTFIGGGEMTKDGAIYRCMDCKTLVRGAINTAKYNGWRVCPGAHTAALMATHGIVNDHPAEAILDALRAQGEKFKADMTEEYKILAAMESGEYEVAKSLEEAVARVAAELPILTIKHETVSPQVNFHEEVGRFFMDFGREPPQKPPGCYRCTPGSTTTEACASCLKAEVESLL